MDALPAELVECIFRRTDRITLPLLSFVSPLRRALLQQMASRKKPTKRRSLYTLSDKYSTHECGKTRECGAYHARTLVDRGHWGLVTWMLDHVLGEFDGDNDLDVYICAEAAAKGDLDRLKDYILNKGYECGRTASENAARHGHLDVIQWVRANGCPWNGIVYVNAGDRLDTAEWARRNGRPWDASVCARVAASGDMRLLEWLWKNGCPWDADTCAAAARERHLDVLKWARSDGCPWDGRVYQVTSYWPIIEWARDNGCPR